MKKEHTYNTVYGIVRDKKLAHIEPHHALFVAEILPALGVEYSRPEAEASIDELCRDNMLAYGTTGNDWWFIPKGNIH